MRTLLPGYPAVMGALEDGARGRATITDFFGGPAELIAGRAGGLDVIAVNAPHLYARPAIPISAPTARTGRTIGAASPR